MSSKSLCSLASRYFKLMGYTIDENVIFNGSSGLLHKFDFVIQKENEERVVMIMDWNRPVGVNMIIKADKASSDINLPNPIVVAKNFSIHAKAYSNRRRIKLITQREILSELHTFR